MTNAALTTPMKTLKAKWNMLLMAIAAAFVFTLVFSSGTKPTDANAFLKSTDDMVRMVIVRDWMAGQSWFDPLLHRLGLAPGTVMHWSRLVDAPIALLIGVGNFFGAPNGERFAAAAWPFLTFVIALMGMLIAVRRTTLSDNMIPALIIGGFGLWSWGSFQSGVIDHHNIQIALGMWVIASVLPSENTTANFRIAGVMMAMLLAIGLESLPLVIAGALAVLVRLVVERDALFEPVRQFGLALALCITVLFFLLIGPQYYGQTYCDSLSLFHLVCAGLGGMMLYATLHPQVRALLPMPYVSAPTIAGASVVGIALAFFPQCLADPVSSIDPVLRHFWLDYIIEAQNIFKIAALDPSLLFYQYVLTLIAFGALIWQILAGRHRLVMAILLIFLTITTAVTLFQMRGVQQSVPVAGLCLAVIATWFMASTGKTKPWLGAAVLLLCCNLFWKLAFVAGMSLLKVEPGPLINQSQFELNVICRTPEDQATLAAEKPGFIAAANGLGAWLLYSTNHRVLSGPYHRNGAGNLASVNIMIGTEEQAHQIMKDAGITLFAVCPQFVDEKQILREVPNGFLGEILAGKKMDWLEPIPATMNKQLMLWRVR